MNLTLPFFGGMLLVSACASTQAATRNNCSSDLARAPEPLATAVDSARFQQEVAALWRPGMDLVLARISYDSVGARSDIAVTSASLPERTRDSLEEVIAKASPRRAAPEQQVNLFLGDSAGPAIRRVVRFAGCAPIMLQRARVAREVQAEARKLGIRDRLVAYVMVHVEKDGSAGAVEVNESSGQAPFDQAAALVMSRTRFLPAMVEGIPVAVWARFPVAVTPVGRDSPVARR